MSKEFSGFFWRAINGTLVLALCIMVILVFINAVLRYVFNSGMPAGEEVSRYLFVWVCALGTIAAYREGRHIGVDLLLSSLTGIPKTIVLLIGQVLTLTSFTLVLWGGWEYFKTSAASPGPATEIPFGFVSASIIVVALSIVLMSIQNIVDLLRKHTDER